MMIDSPVATLSQTLSSLQTLGLDRLDAQLLLLHVLGLAPHQRTWLLAHDTDRLSGTQAQTLMTLANRRLAGEPLAYLTRHKAFYGLDLQVDSHVLVPRPESETLVDWALECLAGQPVQCRDQRVLDLGTGSGAIALAIKASRPELQVYAVDISHEALELAHTNAQRLQLEVSFSLGAWFADLPTVTSSLFDVIVSNPPYIAADDPHLAALGFEPALALISGTEGLDDIDHIIGHAPTHLKPGGWLLLEHGHDQANAVRARLLANGFCSVSSRRDLAGIERCSGGRLQLVVEFTNH